jgi:hypothetical protein
LIITAAVLKASPRVRFSLAGAAFVGALLHRSPARLVAVHWLMGSLSAMGSFLRAHPALGREPCDHADMRSKLNCLLCFLALALPAYAQLDSDQLRVKFGAPLDRETFHIPAGFDLVVDYGVGHQVCKLQVPALMPTGAGPYTNFGNYPYNPDANKVQNTDEMKQKMYAFLAELVPDAMRGKEMGSQGGMTSAFSAISAVIYAHVTITYSQSSNTITVQFKNAACQQPAAH